MCHSCGINGAKKRHVKDVSYMYVHGGYENLSVHVLWCY